MYWNALDGSYLLSKVFSKSVGISDIDLFDIRMDREGSTVIISFDLIDKLPDNPPIKWVKGYNRCRCGINCGGATMIKLEDISTNM
ncbi:Imm50 family immunity protein [Tatumella sp. OPLPL6]|uniref:Imm50 family immunity protein n=1 Tax=Tatumella sp. OPLPL6 TaxID=1928657 RepID=UPI0025711215|nr:Imm50 family immunity protein [Tatumella sp. OPLPL6]